MSGILLGIVALVIVILIGRDSDHRVFWDERYKMDK